LRKGEEADFVLIDKRRKRKRKKRRKKKKKKKKRMRMAGELGTAGIIAGFNVVAMRPEEKDA